MNFAISSLQSRYVNASSGILYLYQGHLLTEKVRKVLIDFVKETQGGTVTYAYSTAFQNLLTDIETAKKVVSL